MMLKIYSVSCFTNMDISAWCFCVEQWVFVVEGRWFCPHRGHGAMCGDIFDCHTGVLLTISGQTSGMLLNILTCTDGPSNKELWGQNTDSAEVEQPSYGELLHEAWFLHLRYLVYFPMFPLKAIIHIALEPNIYFFLTSIRLRKAVMEMAELLNTRGWCCVTLHKGLYDRQSLSNGLLSFNPLPKCSLCSY